MSFCGFNSYAVICDRVYFRFSCYSELSWAPQCVLRRARADWALTLVLWGTDAASVSPRRQLGIRREAARK